MCHVRGLAREDHFGITGQFDFPRDPGTVLDGDAPQFQIILRGDADFSVDVEVRMAVPELGARLREDRLVALRGLQDGLICG